MKKSAFLGIGALALLVVPLAASAVVLEGSFSGAAKHNGPSPGVYTVGQTYTAYQILNTTQFNPWYPWNAARQYTAVLTAQIQSYVGGMAQVVTWHPGTVVIYEDNPGGGGTAANYASTATFTDGTLILSGAVQNMVGQRLNVFGLPWGITGVMVFTGGSGLGSVNSQCTGGLVMNDFINFQIGVPPTGYKEFYDGKWECPDVTSTEVQTWGRVKGLYR
jgi:hypothetical protein